MKKQPLTITEHLEMGRELQRLQLAWQERYVALTNRYGVTNAAVRMMRRANEAMSQARSFMDSQCCLDSPDMFYPGIYYPSDGTQPCGSSNHPDACMCGVKFD